MKKYLSIAIIFLAVSVSCKKETVDFQISGAYANYDSSWLSRRYITFENGILSVYESEKGCVFADGCLWLADNSDRPSDTFRLKESGKYSIRDGYVYLNGEQFAQTGDSHIMMMDGECYEKVESFTRDAYSTIILGNWATESQIVTIPYEIRNPLPQGKLSVTFKPEYEWISNLTVTEDRVSFTVGVHDEWNRVVITFEYPGAYGIAYSRTIPSP